MRILFQTVLAAMLIVGSNLAYSQCAGPIPLLCDADGDFDIDSDDIFAISAAKGALSSGPGDIRDIDGDGVITLLDARQCVARCEESLCVDPTASLISVPDVVGLPQVSAESDIIAAGLTVGTVSTAVSTIVPVGSVISQSPAASALVLQDSAVDLVVSLGPALITTPDVVGLSQAVAGSDIVAAGLVVGAVSTATSGSVPPGEVISQNPPAGAQVAPGSSIDLIVSLGVVLTSIPDVVGLSQTAAEVDITLAGLVVGAVSTATSGSVPPGEVISQNPPAGITVAPGSSIDLVVSLGAALIATPDVVGLSQTAAEAGLVGADLVVGTVSTSNSSSVPAGDVISQNPASGALVAPGSSVDLVVSLGAALISMPDVVGLSQSAAEAEITRVGLVVGTISTVNSSSIPAGDVISQGTAAGALVAPGIAVDLVVSLGSSSEVPSIDANGDGVIDSLDVSLIEDCESVQTTLQPECEYLDVDGNGMVDAEEVGDVLARLSAATYDADVNEDGEINSSDLTFVNSCFGLDISVNDNCVPADIDGDSVIDDVDVSIVTARLGETGLPFMRPADTTRLIATTTGEVLANRIQVLLNDPSRSEADALAASVGGSLAGYLPAIGYFTIEFPDDLTPAEIDFAVQTTSSSPLVAVASPATLAALSSFVSDLDSEGDPNEQDAYDLIRLRQAWATLDALSPGLSKVGVGVVDTGLLPHRELPAARVTGSRPSSAVDSLLRRICGLPGLCPAIEAQIVHGTFVASIIAADNKDDLSSVTEFSGVAGGYLGSKLRTRVTRIESFESGDILNAIAKAAADPNTLVVNVSLGGSLCTAVGRTTACAQPSGFFAFTTTLRLIVRQYSTKLFVFSAGNDSIDVLGNAFATLNSEPNVMVVAGLDSSGRGRDSASNGQVTPGTVSMGAPFSVYGASKNIILTTSTYEYSGGTSFSAPMVAGAAALAMSLDKSLKNNPSGLKSVLENSASPIPDTSVAGRRLNMCGVVERALSISSTTFTENFDSILVPFDNTRPQLTRFSIEDNVNNVRYLNTRLSSLAGGLLPPSSGPNAVDQAFYRRSQGKIGQPIVVIAKDCGWTKVTFRYARVPDFFVTAYAGKLPDDLASSFWNRLETRPGIQAQPGGLTTADLPEVAGLRLLDSQRVPSRAGGSMGTVTIAAPPGEKIDFLLIGGQDSFPTSGFYSAVGIDDIVFEK